MPGSQKYSPNSDWTPQPNLLKAFDVSLEMSSDPKKYFGFTFGEFTEFDIYTVNCLVIAGLPGIVSKTKTPKTEDLHKPRPTKTKTPYENEDPFIFCRKRNYFNITLLDQNWWITAVHLEIDQAWK